MSILGTCQECLHHKDGMCNLRPRICLNYDHFERRPMVTLTRDDFEKLYISRAAYDELNAKVAALQAELTRAIDIYKDPAVTHANILNGRIVLPKFYVNITDDFGPVADLRAALAAANEDAELPDYNPNGTANPKGDAAYWRTRAEAAENVINAAHAVLARQVAEPHTSRGDTNAMVEVITILETVTLKGGEE